MLAWRENRLMRPIAGLSYSDAAAMLDINDAALDARAIAIMEAYTGEAVAGLDEVARIEWCARRIDADLFSC